MSSRLLAAIALTALLGACASTPPDLKSAELPDPADYSKNPFVPVNLYINANQHSSGVRADLLEYAAAKIENSNAFLRTDRGTQRWLYTLQLKFRPQTPVPGHLARRILSALSLGLIPVRLAQTEFLEAEIFLEPEPVAKFSYVQPYDDTVSLYRLGDPNRDARGAVDLLLKRLMAEVAATKAVPRARDFDESPAQEKKPPPKPKVKETPT